MITSSTSSTETIQQFPFLSEKMTRLPELYGSYSKLNNRVDRIAYLNQLVCKPHMQLEAVSLRSMSNGGSEVETSNILPKGS